MSSIFLYMQNIDECEPKRFMQMYSIWESRFRLVEDYIVYDKHIHCQILTGSQSYRATKKEAHSKD